LENDKFQLGVTAENIIRKSDKPVFVIKNNQKFEIKNILCPVDFSQESGRALSNALIIARMFKAKLVILSVYSLFRQTFSKLEASTINEQRKKDHEVEFNKFLKPFNFVDVNVERVLKGGDSAIVILKSIQNIKADLVIMGTTGKSGFNRVLMGSVTEKVVREVLCSSITLKKEDVITLEIDSKIRDIENHYETAEKLFEKGFFEESLKQFKICLDINYTHIPSLKGISKVYKKLGEVEKARKYQETVKNILDQMWNMKIEKEVRDQRKHQS
jgi:universal stress protein E